MRGLLQARDLLGKTGLEAPTHRRHEDHRLLPVPAALRVGLAHEDAELAARVARARGPPLAPVEDVVVAVALDAASDVGGVGGGDARLGHGEARADLAGEQRFEPLLLLLGRAVAGQHLHVAGVGRRAVEHLGRPGDAPHHLAQRRVLEVGQAGAVARRRAGRGSTARPPAPGLQLLHDRGGRQRSAASCS